MARPRICLNMIVKDEAPVIGRCLDALRLFVDHWLIVDTGSSDGTQDLVRRHLAGLPGALHERPWRNFAHNRNEALALARDATGPGDYVFFIDADETLALPPGQVRPALDAEAYDLRCDYEGTSYRRCALVAMRLPWRWEGVVHESIVCDQPVQRVPLEGPRIVVVREGARSRDPDTFRKDAALLEAALLEDPTHARNMFYLAQSWRDAGEPERALQAYRRRAAMGGWDEEVWYALYQAAALSEQLQAPPAEIAFAYQAAYSARPSRAEPLVQLARFHRLRGEHALALLYARHAAAMPRPDDLLFVDDTAYAWQALDELSVAAWYAGARAEGEQALARLLAVENLPAEVRARAEGNARFYR